MDSKILKGWAICSIDDWQPNYDAKQIVITMIYEREVINLEGWNANYVNDPNDDFNVALEILHNDEDVALVYQSDSGLKLKYYANENDSVIPVNWLLELLSDAEKKLSNTK